MVLQIGDRMKYVGQAASTGLKIIEVESGEQVPWNERFHALWGAGQWAAYREQHECPFEAGTCEAVCWNAGHDYRLCLTFSLWKRDLVEVLDKVSLRFNPMGGLAT